MCNGTIKATALLLCLLFSSARAAEQDQLDSILVPSEIVGQKCENACNARIEFVSLCAKKLKALCADLNKLNADELCVALANVLDLKAQNGCVNNLCVDNLKANNFEHCNKYRATVVPGAPSSYTLGDPLTYDVILDDPNGNVSTVPFFSYTAPVSGYYIATFELDANGFNFPNESILGTPVANPGILINGAPIREDYKSFLAFHDAQHSLMTTLIRLKKGDVITLKYNVISMNDIGFHYLVGTTNIMGNGTDANQSIFKIHYLSSDCSNPCAPCNVPGNCTPCPSVSCCS